MIAQIYLIIFEIFNSFQCFFVIDILQNLYNHVLLDIFDISLLLPFDRFDWLTEPSKTNFLKWREEVDSQM